METRVKALEEQIDSQNKRIEAQDKKIEELTGIIGAAKSTTSIGEKTKAELPKIPKDILVHKSKNYKWTAASFFLPGDPKRYISQDVVTDVAVIAKLLAVKGQTILVEQA